ncbi:helix-turn-helix domain-containing protein [Herbiconiux ginsengi]|uniref:Transcriptional regulator, XRE family with cupin sensor n=1 Tax=Herbiconiux ginsengi TaxID=381665 RepID=A0A1H3QNV2_9MICO|nr:XRE family transcriptional regulator [Herbiconiux ginsengi]SDZ15010.1 transcriptional regulator, XRE family with cupin sensor [Herbiconiux ginsengi]
MARAGSPRERLVDAVRDNGAPGMGAAIRQARTAEGISLRELGRRVGVSASFISQVELGRATPSIGTLYTIVSELDLSLDSLLATAVTGVPLESGAPTGEAAAAPVGERLTTVGIPGLQRAGTAPDIRVDGVRWERLTVQDDPLVEYLRVTYAAGSESNSVENMMRHAGWEYLHVLTGQMDLQVGFDKDTLQPGDSLSFDSTIPHRISNPYTQDCVSIWAVVGRHGFAHPREIAEQVARLGRHSGGEGFGYGSHYGATGE